MAFFTYPSLLAFAQSNGYFLIFLVMVVEGPMITTAAAFAASLGYFNIYIIFLLSLLGDLVGDFLHYWIGRSVRRSFIEKYGHRVGLGKRAIAKLELRMKQHLGKTMLIVKMTPIASIGLLLAGALKAPFRRFLLFSFLITLPRTVFFVSLGYFFGWATGTVLTYFEWGQYSLFALVLFVAAACFLFRKATRRMREHLEQGASARSSSTSGRARGPGRPS
jgi:membrane-associated protein